MLLGIDPGANGAAVLIDKDGKIVDQCLFKSSTEHDIWDFFSFDLKAKFCYLEKTHSSPQMGVRSAHTFGLQTGFLRGMLIASSTPFDLVLPAKWQKAMGCMTRGDKNVSKQRAQELFPSHKITHANADAILIAEHCRRCRA